MTALIQDTAHIHLSGTWACDSQTGDRRGTTTWFQSSETVLTGGMAYEALNNASSVKGNFIIVLNDNNMSISENVGGISQYLSGFRTADAYRDLKNNVMNS